MKRCDDGSDLVVKKYTKEVAHWHGNVPMQYYILKTVLPPHHRIIDCQSFLGIPGGQVELGFELCNGGNLTRFVDDKDGVGRSEPFLWNVFIQIADALALLRKYYHSDHLISLIFPIRCCRP